MVAKMAADGSESGSHRLDGKVIVVTGGAGLLGRHFCRAIARAGGIAVLADIDEKGAGEAASALAGEEGAASGTAPADRFVPCALDIGNRDSIWKAIAEVKDRCGRIDALVNNAYPRNARYGRKFEEVTHADFCENLSLHLGGYFLMMQQFVEYFRPLGKGVIVNLSSIYGFLPPRFDVYEGCSFTMPVEYAAIKAGILQLTKYLARYLEGTGIRINALSPGGILNGQDPRFLNRYREYALNKGMLDPEDVCGTLVFLLSDASAFMNGQNLVVDDGFSL